MKGGPDPAEIRVRQALFQVHTRPFRRPARIPWNSFRARQREDSRMTTSANDFDAAKAVADQLKGMEKERQHRILRWVAESLNLDLGLHEARDERTGGKASTLGSGISENLDPQRAVRPQRPPDIKTFVDSKRPKSDVQFAAVVAYYYRFEASAENRRDSINAEALRDAARLSGRRQSPKPLMTLNNAKRLGYLDSPERGQFRINSVGENLVAMTLPGSEPESSGQRAVRPRKPRRQRPKKR